MKILQSPHEKSRYRDMENILFDTETTEKERVIIKKYKYVKKIEIGHTEIGQERFFNKMRDVYSSQFSEFCVSDGFYDNPIYLFDFKGNTYADYAKIMWYPADNKKQKFPFENGMAIICDLVLIYNARLKWCIVSDRYNDVILFGSDYDI